LEREALVDFYNSTQGDWWRISTNWLVGDPCQNHWYGVTCNTRGQVIVLHLFENAIDGLMPDSFKNLKYLKHLTIANDGREHEGEVNPHRNTIHYFNGKIITQLINLEEINMQHLGMHGPLSDYLSNLHKLKYLNLGYNQLSGPISNVPAWVYLKDLRFIELMSNTIGGPLPTYWNRLPNLEYVDVSYNNFTGSMLILDAA
jgi:hypothetical protein